MEQFIDGLACRVYEASTKGWKVPLWDSLTDEQRQAYRDYAARMPFRTYDPTLCERFNPA